MKSLGGDVSIYYNSTYVTIKNLEVRALETDIIAVYTIAQVTGPQRSPKYKASSWFLPPLSCRT